MKLLINIIAIIVVAVVIGFQFNRTKNLYNKKYDENKDEVQKRIRNNKTKLIISKRAAIMAALKYYQLLIISY